jgi:hypothetical protein
MRCEREFIARRQGRKLLIRVYRPKIGNDPEHAFGLLSLGIVIFLRLIRLDDRRLIGRANTGAFSG